MYTFGYHLACGHFYDALAGAFHEGPTDIATCESQPDFFIRDSLRCNRCIGQVWLSQESIDKRTAEVLLRQAEQERYRAEVNERNEPLEEIIYSIPTESLTLVEARQLHLLRYQHIEILLPGDAEDLSRPGHLLLEARRAKLAKAIFDIPIRLLQQFTTDEWLTHIEILRWTWADDIYSLSIVPSHKQQAHIEKVYLYENVIKTQLVILFQTVEHDQIPRFDWCREQSFELRWRDLNVLFFRGQEQWRPRQDPDNHAAYDSDEFQVEPQILIVDQDTNCSTSGVWNVMRAPIQLYQHNVNSANSNGDLLPELDLEIKFGGTIDFGF